MFNTYKSFKSIFILRIELEEYGKIQEPNEIIKIFFYYLHFDRYCKENQITLKINELLLTTKILL